MNNLKEYVDYCAQLFKAFRFKEEEIGNTFLSKLQKKYPLTKNLSENDFKIHFEYCIREWDGVKTRHCFIDINSSLVEKISKEYPESCI